MTSRNQKLLAGAVIGGALAARGIAHIREAKAFSFQGAKVLITGGSRGLGLVIARQLAKEGARLSLVARDHDRLMGAAEELALLGAKVLVIPADVTQRDEADRVVCQTVEQFGSLDVLINNAGMIQVGPMEDMTLEDFEQAMATHAWGPLYLMLSAIPHMRKEHRGRIVNVSSVGGKVAVPHLLPYAMSKFALAGLSDVMGAELRKDGIYVTTVFPGLMRTGSHVNASFKGQHRTEYALFSAMAANPLLSMNAERAAQKIIDACRVGKAHLVIGTQARLAIALNCLFPNLTAELAALAARLLPRATESTEARSGRESGSAWSPSVLTRLADREVERNNESLKDAV